MKRTYLCGPMTGLPEFNYPAFNEAAATLRAMGYEVENPADNPRQDSWEAYMRAAITQMLTCDAVALMPGWGKSRGAHLEHDVAENLGLVVMGIEFFTKLQKLEPALPEWQCHKRVCAAKILAVTRGSHTSAGRLSLDGGANTDVDAQWLNKHNPEAGGYFVQYGDGYTSYSPAKAFEEGYSPVPVMIPIEDSPEMAEIREFLKGSQWTPEQQEAMAHGYAPVALLKTIPDDQDTLASTTSTRVVG